MRQPTCSTTLLLFWFALPTLTLPPAWWCMTRHAHIHAQIVMWRRRWQEKCLVALSGRYHKMCAVTARLASQRACFQTLTYTNTNKHIHARTHMNSPMNARKPLSEWLRAAKWCIDFTLDQSQSCFPLLFCIPIRFSIICVFCCALSDYVTSKVNSLRVPIKL